MTKRKMMGYIDSNLRALNDLMGGLPIGSMCGMFGPAESGKTIGTVQFAFDTLKRQGGNGLVIDTEGSSFTYMEWIDTLNRRYGMDVKMVPVVLKKRETKELCEYQFVPESEPEGQALYVIDVREINVILKILGRGCNFNQSNSGKITLKIDNKWWVEEVEETPIAKFIEEKDITYFAFDSVTYPVKMYFGPNQENFPARSQATGYMMQQLQVLASRYKLIQFGVMHHSLNESDQFAKPTIYGGANIKYSYKFVVYIARDQSRFTPPAGGKRPKTVRELWLYRHPNREPWARVKYLALNSRGFQDYDLDKGMVIEDEVVS